MSVEEEVVALRAENAQVRADLAAALELIAQLQARVGELEQRRRRAFKAKTAKAKTAPKDPATPRKKRAAEHNAGRRREEPTQTAQHA